MDSYPTQSMSWNDSLATGTSGNQTDDNAAIMPIEVTNFTGTRLEHLNEDCLLEIFSCNSLTLMDLCSLAETCTRFKQITQRVFATGYDIDWTCHEFRSKNYNTRDIGEHDIHRILKNFGLHLSTLSIDRDCQDVVNWVEQYCDDVTLKSLKICRMDDLDDIIKPLDSIFERVQKLTIYECGFLETVPWFALNCSSLIELKIKYSNNCTEIMECTFPHLERFTWRFTCNEMTKNRVIMCEFISRHDHLKLIDIWSEPGHRLLHEIGSNCNELHKLCLSYSAVHSFSTSFLGSLTKLKILELDFQCKSPSRQCEYITLLEAAKSLAVMKMFSCHEDGISPRICNVLSQLTHLRELHLTSYLINRISWTLLAQLRKVYLTQYDYGVREIPVDLPNIIKQLDNLEELVYGKFFYDKPYLSERDFLKICKIVERREHVLTLKCKLSSELEKYCDDKRRVKLINFS